MSIRAADTRLNDAGTPVAASKSTVTTALTGAEPMRRAVLVVCMLAGLVGGLVSADLLAATRQQAVAQALANDGNTGKVLSVRKEDRDGRSVWAVKVLTDGRVRVHRIPAD